jgi:hypothetical protein
MRQGQLKNIDSKVLCSMVFQRERKEVSLSLKGQDFSTSVHWSQIHESTMSLRFLDIILRVLRLEVSVYNVYITN